MKTFKKDDYVLSNLPNISSRLHNKIGILLKDSFMIEETEIAEVRFFISDDIIPVKIPLRYLTKVDYIDYAEFMI